MRLTQQQSALNTQTDIRLAWVG